MASFLSVSTPSIGCVFDPVFLPPRSRSERYWTSPPWCMLFKGIKIAARHSQRNCCRVAISFFGKALLTFVLFMKCERRVDVTRLTLLIPQRILGDSTLFNPELGLILGIDLLWWKCIPGWNPERSPCRISTATQFGAQSDGVADWLDGGGALTRWFLELGRLIVQFHNSIFLSCEMWQSIESWSHWRAELRNWAIRPVRAGCYSWTVLSLTDSKTLKNKK